MRRKHLAVVAAAALAAVALALIPGVGPVSAAEQRVAQVSVLGDYPLVHTLQGFAGKCIDVPGGVPADGVPLQLYDCNGTAAQVFTTGPLGEAQALGMCMDAAGGSGANGTTVQLARCNGSGAQQWWIHWPQGRLWNKVSGKCVDVAGWATGNGARLQLWDCTDGANQTWRAVAA